MTPSGTARWVIHWLGNSVTFTGDLRESFISGLPQFQIPFSPHQWALHRASATRRILRRGGRELRRDGKETDKSWTKDITRLRGERERKKKKKGRKRDERRADIGGTQGRNVAKVICTELSFFSAFCSNSLSKGSAGWSSGWWAWTTFYIKSGSVSSAEARMRFRAHRSFNESRP